MKAAAIAANILGWPILQLSIAWAATRLPSRYFANDGAFYRVRAWELHFYRDWLRVKRWKRSLPDGAPWVGGTFRKTTMASHKPEYLQRFVLETRRGEMAHWLMMACFPVFCLWNPPWACGVMALYAFASNAPCIAAQRYNRGKVLSYRKSSSGPYS